MCVCERESWERTVCYGMANWRQNVVMCFEGIVVLCVMIERKTREVAGRRDKLICATLALPEGLRFYQEPCASEGCFLREGFTKVSV